MQCLFLCPCLCLCRCLWLSLSFIVIHFLSLSFIVFHCFSFIVFYCLSLWFISFHLLSLSCWNQKMSHSLTDWQKSVTMSPIELSWTAKKCDVFAYSHPAPLPLVSWDPPWITWHFLIINWAERWGREAKLWKHHKTVFWPDDPV